MNWFLGRLGSLLPLLALLFVYQVSHACENPTRMLFAPAFGKAFLQSFLQEEIKVIQSINDCEPIIISTNSFSDMLRHLRENDYDITFIPSMYAPYVSKVGYTRILSGFKVNGIFVARSDANIVSLSDFEGGRVLLNDPLSQASADWHARVLKNKISGKNTVIYGGKTETLLYKLLNKEADVAFSIGAIYKKLSPVFKVKLKVIDQQIDEKAASVMISNRKSTADRKRLTKSLIGISDRWSTENPKKYNVPNAMHLKILNKLGIE